MQSKAVKSWGPAGILHDTWIWESRVSWSDNLAEVQSIWECLAWTSNDKKRSFARSGESDWSETVVPWFEESPNDHHFQGLFDPMNLLTSRQGLQHKVVHFQMGPEGVKTIYMMEPWSFQEVSWRWFSCFQQSPFFLKVCGLAAQIWSGLVVVSQRKLLGGDQNASLRETYG